MTLKPRFGFSAVLVSLVALAVAPGPAGFAYGAVVQAAVPAQVSAAEAPTPAPAPAPAPRLTAVRAAVAPEAVSLTLEVAGEFTYLSSNPAERLTFIDVPGGVSALPPESHILESGLVSSYRTVSYLLEGRPNVRVEVLLKKAATVTAERKGGALQVKFVRAAVSASAGAASAGRTPPASVAASAAPSASPAPKPSAPVSLRARGTAIERVSVAREEGVARVQILTNGPVEYRVFQLANPARLVLDIPATESRTANREIPVGLPPLKSVRVSQFSQSPLVSRVVIDLDGLAPYEVHRLNDKLEVELKIASGRSYSKPAARPVLSENTPEIAVPPSLENLVGRAPQGHAALRPADIVAPPPVAQATAREAAAPDAKPEPARPEQAIAVAPDTKPATQPPATSPATQLATRPEAPPLAPMNVAAAVAPMAAQAAQPRPPQTAPPQPAPPAEQTPALPQTAMMAPRYTGEPISVNLKDVDLKDFFRLIHEISGLNIVLDPTVSGRVTIVLEDVPWDQALDIVLRNNGLDKQLEGNVLRIARRDTLKREEDERLALDLAKQAAAERVTAMRPLNYARATEMMVTLSKFRSPKGEIIADDRTNTLIITDIPQVIPTLDDIIRQLDRRSVQVEIEARVVAASRQFARDVGAQFGFGTSAAGGRSLFMGNNVGENDSPLSVPTGRGGLSFPGPFTVEGDRLPLFSNFPAAGASSGLSFIHRSPNAAIDFFISLAETKGIGKLLSRPRIITQNNKTGEVQQGVRIPVQTTINNTISVQFINATLRLSVRPQVTNEGSIFLDVTVDNSSIDPGVARINGVPALNTQQATTQVLVNDGGTIVFGGVLQNQNNLSILQVPLLGSIPVIGNLFKRTGVTTQTNELLFFITPKIV